MFICLVISHEFSTIRYTVSPTVWPSICHCSCKQFILLWFSRAPGSPYTFFWQRDPYVWREVGSFFLTLEIQSIILQRQMQTDIFETCQYLDLTFVVGLLLYILFYLLQFCWHNVIYLVPMIILCNYN